MDHFRRRLAEFADRAPALELNERESRSSCAELVSGQHGRIATTIDRGPTAGQPMTEEPDFSTQVEDAKRAYSETFCDPKTERLELRLRVFEGGSKHFVWQCLKCGEHRGGALGAAAARAELGGKEALDFDVGLVARHRQEQDRLLSIWTALSEKQLGFTQPEMAAYLLASRGEYEARQARIKALVDDCAQRLAAEGNELAAADALSAKAVAIRRERRKAAMPHDETQESEFSTLSSSFRL